MKKLLIFILLISIRSGAQQFQWVTPASSPQGNQSGSSVRQDGAGNTYIINWNSAVSQFGNMVADSGHAVIKYGISGTVLSVINLPFRPAKFEVDPAGNLYFSGTFTTTAVVAGTTMIPKGLTDTWLLKTDNTGSPLWIKQIGGSSYEQVNFKADKSGNLYLGGGFSGSKLYLGSDSLLNPTAPAMFFSARIRPDGSLAWLHNGLPDSGETVFGCNGLTVNNYNKPVYLTSAGNCPSCARQQVSTFDSSGTKLSEIILDTDTTSTYFRADISGLWMDDSLNIFTTASGYRYDGGSILKYCADGQLRWGYSRGYSWSCKYYPSWAVDKAGNLYLACNKTPQGGYCGPNAASPSYDIVIKKLRPDASVHWEKKVIGAGHEIINDIVVDEQGNCFMTGVYNYNSFEPAKLYNMPAFFDNYSVLNNHVYSEVFTAKLGAGNWVGVSEITENKENVNVYPNPTNGKLTLAVELGFIKQLTVSDVFGKQQLILFPAEPKTEIDLGYLPGGLYIVTCEDAEGRKEIHKVLKH